MKIKKILCLFLCLAAITATFTSCSRPPEIEDIKGRLSELIEASYEVNVLLFGEGPETYERVYDPKTEMKYYENDGNRYYYFYFEDAELGRILAYRTKAYGDDYNYLLVTENANAAENDKCIYTDSEEGLYYFSIEYDYSKNEKDFYYDSNIPEDYDVVRLDENYISSEKIKKSAEKVYSADYLKSVYEALFTGIMISDDTSSGLLSARYAEYEDTNGTIWFMKSNTYEPIMKEKRIYDLSTAVIARGSNAKRVRIEISSYLESAPDDKQTVIINLVLQNGEWFLDNPTY